jgi:hypothetical protein
MPVPVAEDPAKRSHVDAKIGLLDERVWPDPSDQFILCDQRTGAFGEDLQDLDHTTARRSGFSPSSRSCCVGNSRYGPNAIAPLAADSG